MNKNNYCVIMAGGVGSRFWPFSKSNHPKQFLDVLGTGQTLIQQTFQRFNKIIPAENFIIVTNEDYKELINEQLPEVKDENILLEPMRKNTAPCIAYANYKIRETNPEANIVVAPSDHLIMKEQEFLKIIEEGLDFTAANKALLTIGIKPSRPETGYGYIQVNANQGDLLNKTTKVKTFTEKPDLKMAKVFLDSGEFFWNSGIFFWSLPTIMDSFSKNLPDVNNLFSEGIGKYNTPEERSFIDEAYPNCKSISLDYGIMEKADNVYVICADFGWSDLGTWGSLYEHSEKDNKGNAVRGENVFSYDLNDCIVKMPDDKLAVIQGLSNYIVVESNNTLLICRKEDEQKIKQFVNDVKIKKGESYL